jgi:hypothetical protein
MTISDQIDALQKRAADLKSSFDKSRQETNEQVKARLSHAKADIDARQSAAKEKAEQAADRTQSQWKSMKADAAAKCRRCRTASTANATSMTSKRQKETPRTRSKTQPMPWITPPGPSTRLNWLSFTP